MQIHPFAFMIFIASIILDIFFLILAIFYADRLFVFIAILLLAVAWLIYKEYQLYLELLEDWGRI
ncbi:hypothetical protein IAE19_08035 [Acinetobacter sp. S40]|nr:hypothetical protein [Acinetobacter sp. S40]MBK0063740.1 hypothetical protein [Acinetobacter sp. S55]MBK0066971.1 hypothetical protein [Acinetobacter sp. S54]